MPVLQNEISAEFFCVLIDSIAVFFSQRMAAHISYKKLFSFRINITKFLKCVQLHLRSDKNWRKVSFIGETAEDWSVIIHYISEIIRADIKIFVNC